MMSNQRIFQHSQTIFLFLLLIFFVSCQKPEPSLPEGPKGIRVEAKMPELIYSNVKKVYLDASRTISLNSVRALFFSWSCTSFPASSGLPTIKDSTKPLAIVENLGIGEYIFNLKVKDNLGNFDESSYTVEVREDTLAGKKPIAKAGPDQQITSPKHTLQIDASETIILNPWGRGISTLWHIIEKPAGNSTVSIQNFNQASATIFGLTEGDYKVQLVVTNDIGLSAYDTMGISVLPDPLKGTTRIFEDENWENWEQEDAYGSWSHIAIVVPEKQFFEDRFEGNMEVKVWDYQKKDWSDPNEFEWTVVNGSLYIIYPRPDEGDTDDYYKMKGVKARVQVKFL